MPPILFPGSQVQISCMGLICNSAYKAEDEVKSIWRKALFIKQGIYFRRRFKKLYHSGSNTSFFLWSLFLTSRARLKTINRSECDPNIPRQFVAIDWHGSADITILLISCCKLYLARC